MQPVTERSDQPTTEHNGAALTPAVGAADGTAFYIAVVFPERSGGWSVLFPDFPGSAIHCSQVRDALASAIQVIDGQLAAARQQGREIPQPQSYEAIRADPDWASDRGIDWSQALVTVLPFNPS